MAGIDLEAHHEDVRRLVLATYGAKIVAAGLELEDTLQEIYRAILIRNGGRCPYDSSKGALSTYVLMVAWGTISNLIEHSRRRPTSDPMPDNFNPMVEVEDQPADEWTWAEGLTPTDIVMSTQVARFQARGATDEAIRKRLRGYKGRPSHERIDRWLATVNQLRARGPREEDDGA